MYWFLEPTALQIMRPARSACREPAPAALWEAQREAEDTQHAEGREGQLPRGMSIAGSTAEIRVEGVLTKRPDFFAMFYGGGNTTYTTIRQSLDIAASNTAVKDVVMFIDSPGGQSSGLFELLDAIAGFRSGSGKKLRVRAENAQSAAYGIAAAAGNIEAIGRGATFGSVGTATAYYLDDHVIELTNTDSPDKRPDLTTDAGKAVIVKFLDQLNAEFVRAIAQGRGVDAKTVNESYGRGASMTAVEAKRLGMIDKITTTAPRAVPSSKGKAMPGDEQTDNRAAIDAAVQRGVEQERDRVRAHLTMGESCGDVSIALEAIRSGAGMTLELNARYLSAGMNRSDRSKRQGESNTAEATLKGVDAATSPGAPDLGDQVVTALKGDRSFVRG
jgi:ClpP class serine protease